VPVRKTLWPFLAGCVGLLLLPGGGQSAQRDPSESYVPKHKGGIDLSTGVYVRNNDDLIVSGSPPVVLRRTYRTRDRVSRHFGIGTTHNGEAYLIGDPEQFSWVSLILADGGRIRFERTSVGRSYMNAMFEHRSTSTEFRGARLAWTGLAWTMRFRDGRIWTFLPCRGERTCSLVEERDSDGHTVRYRRDRSRRLLRIETNDDRWISFDYDASDRITRASASTGRQVSYTYDGAGRLWRVTSDTGTVRTYTYTHLDEMQTIADPDIFIENSYDTAGRCVRQINRFPGEPEPYSFKFDFRGEGHNIVETRTTRSDGTWSHITFGPHRYPVVESWGSVDFPPITVRYERDPVTTLVTAMTVTCPNRSGTQQSHFSGVQPGYEDWTRHDLLQTHCSSSDWSRRRRGAEADRQPG
jgi:YD repeat-containing protein